MSDETPLPLAGIQVLEIGGGAAGAYCGRLLADAGATVQVTALAEHRRLAGILRADSAAERAYAAYLGAGKHALPAVGDPVAFQALSRRFDLVLVGEDVGEDAGALGGPDPYAANGGVGRAGEATSSAALRSMPRIASIDLTWFGQQGAYRHWRGSDLVVQALTGMPQMAGAVDGPPLAAGDRQATTLGGVTAYIAACAALLGAHRRPAGTPRRLDVSILEANLVMAEMHLYFFGKDGVPMQRHGINRFAPNSPVGIYPCQTGWVGITVATPDQWRGLCRALGLHAQAKDEGLSTRELRFTRLDEVEAVLCQALAHKSADEWAAVGRQHRVPIVVVPDAAGMLSHPIFQDRQSLAELPVEGGQLQVPRTPFGLSATPIRSHLAWPAPAASDPAAPAEPAGMKPRAADAAPPAPDEPPLQGITLVDFSMGWAGPLASRLMVDLGAEVLKIEAGRYPDWWRGMNWTPEFIEGRQYELSTTFCGLNRGKQGVSLDLTTPAGRQLALTLVARADAVVENQAAGVMAKFGLDFAQLVQAKPDLVMVSMSAFGTGNAWSDTRAYGSTLEQGSGLPSLIGLPGTAPTMTHLAHGDPVGGLYGCAAMLTALVHRQRGGAGQYVNLSMVEAMLQLTTPGLLTHQVDPAAPLRRGNRRDSLAPHGLYPAAGRDQWLAVAVDSDAAFAALAQVLGRPDWATDPALRGLAGRQAHEDDIDAALTAWARQHPPEQAAAQLQAAGVMAAGLVHAQDLAGNVHLIEADFFIDVERAVSGPQRQGGLAIVQDGQRLGARQPAPLLGEHSGAVLQRHAGLTPAQFDALVHEGVISLSPKPERNLLASPGPAG
jgi:crotonobetainyl-CoA:carnitine CoA-transferase CaiB-like acyl-CoA transferase